ncbi:hypothetical protein CTEN210_00793 [Chaetoceros tenuissimus]|uniref:Uncharacterized protein n=1 Tax=Chaetoceros tenuissimus TaxID=426638 RepID=A0AAD3CET7_9STRA|nr:hypothetical protein CTEN210_00793 [Chaetoceros tenuissimus]
MNLFKSIAARTRNTANISAVSISSESPEFEFVYEDTLPTIPSTLKERKRIFKELEIAFKAQVTTNELGHDKRAKKIHMNKPIPTVYNQHYSKSTKIKKQTRIGTDIYNVSTTSDNGIHEAPFRSLKVEARGITYRQMSAIMANVKRRCEKEGWTREVVDSEPNRPSGTYIRLTPDIVNMHDIERYVIGPYTQATGRSLVESLPSTAGTQPPRFFVVHTWNEKYENTMACVKTMIHDFSSNLISVSDRRGGGMTIDTPIWIDAFATSNQDELQSKDVARAISVAKFRTILVLDKNGEVFSCSKSMEALTYALSNSYSQVVCPIYTAFKHSYIHPNFGEMSRQAIGLVEGQAPIDENYTLNAAYRESQFPMERLEIHTNPEDTSEAVSLPSTVKDALESMKPAEILIPKQVEFALKRYDSVLSEIDMNMN